MKRLAIFFLLLLFLSGCASEKHGIDQALRLRTSLLGSTGCSFDAEITADYGDKIYTFLLACSADREGNLKFTVKEPEYIADIQGQIQYDGGKLTFEDMALAFELQTDDMLSPVSAPWIFLRALRSGYIRSCCQEEDYLRMTVDDSYQEDALMLDIWLDENSLPVRADIYEGNRRILALCIRNFVIL